MTTQIEAIYYACLRTERRLEEWPCRDPTMGPHDARMLFLAIQTLREEIGRAIEEEWPR